MKWSRELRIAHRSMRAAIKAASAMTKARAKLPVSLRPMPLWTPGPISVGTDQIEVAGFGSNPGRLAMFVHVPTVAPAPGAPLIVLLHGCGQAATAFARETGWVALADQLGV